MLTRFLFASAIAVITIFLPYVATTPSLKRVVEATPVTEHTLEGRQTSGPWAIMSWYSRKCLEVHGHSTAKSAQIEQGGCDDTDTNWQRWDFHPLLGADVGYWRISSRAGSKYCLNVQGASKKANAKVIQYPCGAVNQNDQWQPIGRVTVDDGLDYCKLKNRHSHMCLNVQSASRVAGADLIQYPCDTVHGNDWFTWFPAAT
jgi:hypothetical protein